MAGRLEGKVAFITGAARGQGRSHALRLAQEGADIIGIDICGQIPSVPYPMSTEDDLKETAILVEALDRRMIALVADVRDASSMRSAVAAGIDAFGGIDIAVANAGIGNIAAVDPDHAEAFQDNIDVNLTGVWHTIDATARPMIERNVGGSIILTSSVLGLSGRGGDGSGPMSGYAASKHGVVGLMRTSADWLAPYRIRVNTVHPTGVDTPLINNESSAAWIASNPRAGPVLSNLIDIDMLEAVDISNAVLWLASEEARYVTGITVPIDAGFLAK